MKKRFLAAMLIVCFAFLFVGCGGDARASAGKKLTNITIDATLNLTGHTLDVKQTTSFINSSDNVISSVLFNVFANAYADGAAPVSTAAERDAYPNEKSYGSAQITSLIVAGKSTEPQLNAAKTILTVPLATPLYPDDRVEIAAEYSIMLANIRHRLGYADEVVSLAHFYLAPCSINKDGNFVQVPYTQFGDPFVFDCANYKVNFTAPASFIFASSGQAKKTIANTSAGTITTIIDAPASRDFAIIGSKKFKTASIIQNKTKINYYYIDYPNTQDVLDIASQSYAFFTQKFGDPKLPVLNICEAPLIFGGMEYSGICAISLNLRQGHEKYKEVVVHEIAHQWWFNAVGSNQYKEAWLDEALAEFSTSLFMTQNKTQLRTAAAKNLDTLMAFCDASKAIYGTINLKMARPLSDFASSTEYANMVYCQGSLMLYSLYEIVGERTFINALQKYFKQNLFKLATAENLIACFGKAGENFFNCWLEGNVNLAEI